MPYGRYHANNNQKLTKTKLDGTIIWQVNGTFGQATTVYKPTWFATPPDSDYMYVCMYVCMYRHVPVCTPWNCGCLVCSPTDARCKMDAHLKVRY